jgi:hypothetical protein
MSHRTSINNQINFEIFNNQIWAILINQIWAILINQILEILIDQILAILINQILAILIDQILAILINQILAILNNQINLEVVMQIWFNQRVTNNQMNKILKNLFMSLEILKAKKEKKKF